MCYLLSYMLSNILSNSRCASNHHHTDSQLKHVYVCICVCKTMHACMGQTISVCLYVCMYVCMYYACMRVCVYVCMYTLSLFISRYYVIVINIMLCFYQQLIVIHCICGLHMMSFCRQRE